MWKLHGHKSRLYAWCLSIHLVLHSVGHVGMCIVVQQGAISEISHIANWMPWSGRRYRSNLPLSSFHILAPQGCRFTLHNHVQGLWFSGLGSSLSNPLQTKCTDLYINVKCLWWYFFFFCSTFTFQQPQRAFSCTWHLMYILSFKIGQNSTVDVVHWCVLLWGNEDEN